MPAVLRQSKVGWYIEYYAFNSITQGLERKRIKVNRERKKARTFGEFRAITSQMIVEINCKLAAGWSPFVVGQTMPQQQVVEVEKAQTVFGVLNKPQIVVEVNDDDYPLFTEMLQLFLKSKSREITANSMRTYKSFCGLLAKWVDKHYPNLRSNQFTKRMAVDYLDYVYEGNNATKANQYHKHEDGTISNRTYNGVIKCGRSLFNWAQSKCYCEENIFESMKMKREERKTRVIVTEDCRAKVREYFEKENPQFLIICELVHTSLIRPIEISRLQVKMIQLDNDCIVLPSNITKNHKQRAARLSVELKEMLRKHIEGAQPDDYLFADRCWRCGKEAMSSHSYSKMWDTMRKATGLPQEMQLYSLRDTGINGMLKAGVDALSVMQAADHSDLKMTTRYANHEDPELFKRINELAPGF